MSVRETTSIKVAEASEHLILGTIKWFDASKGYGFIVPDNDQAISEDILIHISCLRQHGLNVLNEGMRIKCLSHEKERGFQVAEIYEITQTLTNVSDDPSHEGDAPSSQRAELEGPTEVATVKWYNTVKGYGFATLDGSDDDVFIHAITCRDAGYDGLEPGQKLRLVVRQGPKGLQANDLRVIA